MIKFFRKIRQNLLMENKTGKYFKYAIGEIVLVVIGILIALQINNWNEQKKEKKFETQILKEIASSIKSDLFRNKAILNTRILSKKIGIEKLIENFNSSVMEHDTILRSYYFKALTNVIFTYDKGPYESLKSAGLDKIKNDSLRSQLVKLYDNILPRGKEMINFDKDGLLQSRNFLEDKIVSYVDYKYNDGWGVKKVFDFKALKTNQDLRKLIDLEENAHFNYIKRINNAIKHSEITLSLIEENLKR